jgi:hypothetical protein
LRRFLFGAWRALGGRVAHFSLAQRIMPTLKFAGNGAGRTFEVR